MYFSDSFSGDRTSSLFPLTNVLSSIIATVEACASSVQIMGYQNDRNVILLIQFSQEIEYLIF